MINIFPHLCEKLPTSYFPLITANEVSLLPTSHFLLTTAGSRQLAILQISLSFLFICQNNIAFFYKTQYNTVNFRGAIVTNSSFYAILTTTN
jgi:hypothetical protein